MMKKSVSGQYKLSAGLASVAALALFTACAAEEPAQDEQPADQQTEQQETTAPADEETTDADDAGDEQTEDAGEASGDDDVYAVIEAVESEYGNGFIIDIDLEDNGSVYEVEVVADNQVYELDVTAAGDITVDDSDDDDDDIREAEQATVTVSEALDEAFSQYADASFDQIQLDEDDGSLHWDIDFDDANGGEIELEIPAT